MVCLKFAQYYSLKASIYLDDAFGIDCFYSFCRHNDLNVAVKDIGSHNGAGDPLQDVFPIQIRLSVLWETNSLVVKVSQKVSFVYTLLFLFPLSLPPVVDSQYFYTCLLDSDW
jgi:hypothetical protein